jgi:hypothetical protein
MPDPPSPQPSVQQALDSVVSDKPMIEQLTGNPYFTAVLSSFAPDLRSA